MDDLLRDFVVETAESLDIVDNELVRFEQEPNNRAIIGQIFRLVHTIKGTCGFLGLPRLEHLTHAAESAISRFRDGAPVTRDAVTLILSTIDRIKLIVAELDATASEPVGDDEALIADLDRLAHEPVGAVEAPVAAPAPVTELATEFTTGSLIYQVLERPLRPGEVSLDELERVFRETPEAAEPPVPAALPAAASVAAPAPRPDAAPAASAVVADPGAETRAEARSADQEPASARASVRVAVETLENLMTTVSELVLTRNQLLEIARRSDNSDFKVPLQRLSHVTAELQESVMKTRMQPIANAWSKLPRIVRDLSAELGKQIDLEMHGSETEIDRQVLDLIRDPMLHMIRNAADHGLETPAARIAAGKDPTGLIRVSAAQEGGFIVVVIADDGRGLDFRRIREKALKQGLATEADLQRMPNNQLAAFIFHPGFSTAEKLTSVSGRGVGMDVVRTNIEMVGGTIDIRSETGKGVTVEIKIPLTLAIAAALIVDAGGQRFALPQVSVVELVRPNGSADARIDMIQDSPVLRLREELLPLVRLSALLGLATSETDLAQAFVAVCTVGSLRFGLVVDGVLHTEEIVVKPVSAKLRHLSCYSGCTILGDGAVIMILDPNGLAQSISASLENIGNQRRNHDAAEETGDRTSLLLFRAGDQSCKAVPLALVTRLEEIEAERIEWADGRPMVQYRGQLMPLIALDNGAPASSGRQSVLVFARNDATFGLVVDEIVDIVEEELEIMMAAERPGIVGSTVVRGRATDIIDVLQVIPALAQSPRPAAAQRPRVVLLSDSDFTRALLAPVVRAAGYQLVMASKKDDLALLARRHPLLAIVADLDSMTAESVKDLGPDIVRIGAATRAAREVIDGARVAGFHDVVGKFDREGLLGTLRELEAMELAA
jgi:two-component system chemotaxis sensor kinase CheA